VPWTRALNFTDPFQCQQSVQAAHVEILPTTKGSFRADIIQVGMNKLWMQRFNFALPQISTAVVNPTRKAIAFLTENAAPDLQHCGTHVAQGDIVLLGFDQLHQRSGTGLQYGAMSLPVEEFPLICHAILGHEFSEAPGSHVIRPTKALMSRLLCLHKSVGQLAHDVPDVLDRPEVRRALEEQLIHTMIRCLAEGVSMEAGVGDRRHDLIIRRFEQYLEAHPDQPLYLTEICAGIGVAERTLRASCEEHLGMGPIRYLTLRRMYLTRRALLRADPSKSTVTRIVTDHGFWELGRFAVAYRALFEESPSETLRRPPDQTALRFKRRPFLAVARPS
jgi:AraC-like DNA-binding protein